MKLKKLASFGLASVLSLSIALTGCGSGDKTDNSKKDGKDTAQTTELAEEQILRVNWEQEPPDLDPQTSTDQVSGWIMNNAYEGLVRVDKDGKIEKDSGLAKDWTVSEDGKTYTFNLRDAKWSDGTPITAGDFEFSWKRALDPVVASQYAELFYYIKGAEAYNTAGGALEEVGIKAVDEKTLEVVLENPTPFFLNLTSFVTYMPSQKALVESSGDKYATTPENMVFSGPFVISEWTSNQNLNLKKNPEYWDAENVKLEEIKGDMIVEANASANLYDSGEMDVMRLSPTLLDKYKDTKDYLLSDDSVSWYMQYNMENEFMKNKDIREAFSMSIDRKSFAENVLRDGSVVAEGLVPSGISGGDDKTFGKLRGDALKDHKFDATAAKASLEKGLKELGKTPEELSKSVSFLTGDSDGAKKQAQALQQMWKQNLGLDIKIETVSFKLRLDRYVRKDFSMTMSGWGADYDDPMTFMALSTSDAGMNYSNYKSPEYDALVKKAQTAQGEERMQAMVDGEKLLAQDLPIFPLYYATKMYLQKEYVQNVERHAAGADLSFKNAYILKH